MPPVRIRPRTEADAEATVAFLNRLNVPFPPTTVAEFQADIRRLPSHVPRVMLVAEDAGKVIASAYALVMFWAQDTGLVRLGVSVAPEHQNRGVGTALYQHVMSAIEGWEPKRLHAEVREDHEVARRFASRRGFVETGHALRNSRLDVDDANLDGYDGLADRLGRDGIRVSPLAELGTEDESLWRSVYEVQLTAGQDEPSAEGFSLSFDEWRESVPKQPGVSPETIWLALAGEKPVGVAMLRVSGENGSHVGMGVLREYRGRGIARLLKLRQLEWARENGVRFLYTGNDINNPRMYDINVRMSYQPLPVTINVVRDLS